MLIWLAVLSVWEGAYRVIGWKPYAFPAPSHIVDSLLDQLNVRTVFGKPGYSKETIPARNEIAKLLLEHGADVNHAQNHGETALHAAVQDQNPPLIRILILAGANTAAKTSEGYTPMDIAKFPYYALNDAVIGALEPHRR